MRETPSIVEFGASLLLLFVKLEHSGTDNTHKGRSDPFGTFRLLFFAHDHTGTTTNLKQCQFSFYLDAVFRPARVRIIADEANGTRVTSGGEERGCGGAGVQTALVEY
ncbi:hypothetical protein EVAR_75821_1 [Eumeta japonica]|uniref:Secreted protein n=1 Tax=Eumeta variegata TaxID=151549 RepID=A0A4C1TD62_EUMVA|nr:hypothetical protein EVAR_75821_1 [Eumeta japonica]